MTHGVVVELQAQIEVVFRLPTQPDLTIEFVVDTGFAGALTLPPVAVAALGLPFSQIMPTNLADDSHIQANIHEATILWDGHEVDVAVLAMGKRPLLGTALLDGYNLNADFEDNGAVTVTRL
jgi:clan AA aspartic protease